MPLLTKKDNHIVKVKGDNEKIKSWFENSEIKQALAVCQVESLQIKELCKEPSRRRWCMHTDLGVLMNRHSTLASDFLNN